MNYYLTFDIGTTAVKTCIFDGGLNLCAIANDEYQLETDANGHVELEPQTYWDAVCHGMSTVLASSKLTASAITAICATTQGETLIPVAADGTPLRKAIVWLDERAGEQAAALSQKLSAERFYRATGLPELNGYLPLAKLMWIRENEPEVYEKTAKFLLLEDYLIFRLTGRFVTEKCLACSTGWYTFETDGIWQEALRLAQIDPDKLPEMLESGCDVDAGLLPDVRCRFGFSAETRVVTGAMDQTAGAIGAGNLTSGRVTETTGTALCIGATLTSPDLTQATRVTVYRHVRSGLYLMMLMGMTAGMFLKWFKDNFCEEQIRAAEAAGKSVYALFDEMVADVPAGAGGLIALPYLTGSVQPHNDPNARGVFFGAGLDTGRPQFLRAVFESVAFMLRENLELLETVDHTKVTEIRSLGGGAKSGIWRQIKADVTGIPVGVPQQSESTSLGAAMLAAVAVGGYDSLESAAADADRAMVWTKPAAPHSYDAAYKKYCALYDCVAPLF